MPTMLRARSLIALLTVAALVAACSDDGSSTSGPSGSPAPSVTTTTSPSPTEGLRDTRAYPFEYADVHRLPVSMPSVRSALGSSPAIPWSEPSFRKNKVHMGDSVVEVPGGLLVSAVVGRDVIVIGGCGKSTGCGDRPRGKVHLLARDGTLTPLDPESGRHSVNAVVSSPAGTEAAWVSDAASDQTLWHYAAGDASAGELSYTPTVDADGFPRVVGFVAPGDVVLSLNDGGGQTVGFTRTSGKQAGWGAHSLTVPAAGVLFGRPTFTPEAENCFSRFSLDSTRPTWSRCYRWGKKAADGFYDYSMSKDGRFLATMILNDLLIVNGRTGDPVRRVRFGDRLQDVAFEDNRTFLAVLSRDEDDWPVSWVVRCNIELQCEQATDRFDPKAHDTVRFVPE